jgi:hypothetical protein
MRASNKSTTSRRLAAQHLRAGPFYNERQEGGMKIEHM